MLLYVPVTKIIFILSYCDIFYRIWFLNVFMTSYHVTYKKLTLCIFSLFARVSVNKPQSINEIAYDVLIQTCRHFVQMLKSRNRTFSIVLFYLKYFIYKSPTINHIGSNLSTTVCGQPAKRNGAINGREDICPLTLSKYNFNSNKYLYLVIYSLKCIFI